MLLKLFIFTKRHFLAPLKENMTFFVKKIRGFVDLKFVKRCHEQVTNFEVIPNQLQGIFPPFLISFFRF